MRSDMNRDLLIVIKETLNEAACIIYSEGYNDTGRENDVVRACRDLITVIDQELKKPSTHD